MKEFIRKYEDRIYGVLSCFDRVIFRGYLPFMSGWAMADPADLRNERRRAQRREATEFAGVVRDRSIPLVFLSACETAMAEADPTSSVAAQLVRSGVGSVVAMSHLVLTHTAQRFVEVFYESLLKGERIGGAMAAGQRALYADKKRAKGVRGADVELDDWFVPVLFQEEADPQLVPAVPGQRVQTALTDLADRALGDLPTLQHGFVGRSRELLAMRDCSNSAAG
jgi:hypothetical protein